MTFFPRARNLLLFARALISIVRFGSRKKVPKGPPRKVLITQFGQLGDMVCVTPVFRALKAHFPHVRVYVLGNALNREVLEGNSDVDEYIVFSEKNLAPIIDRLVKEQIDVACMRGFGFAGLAAAFIAGIPTIITPYAGGKNKTLQTRMYRMLLPFAITVEYIFGSYMPLQFLHLLRPLGIVSSDTKKHLAFSGAALEKIIQLHATHGLTPKKDFIVGITPTAGNKIKEWPAERFAQVADYLIERLHAKVILMGGPQDREKVQ